MPSYGRRKNGTWYVRWLVRNPAAGQPRQPQQGGFRTRADARDWYDRHIAGRQAASSSTARLGDYLQQWLEGRRLEIAPMTFSTYGHAISHISEHLGDYRLRDLAPHHVRAWHAAAVENGLTRTSVRTYHTILAAALNQAVRDGIMIVSPLQSVTPPTSDTAPRPYWEADEIQRFLAITAGDWDYLAHRIMVTTGLRPGESLALTWDDVDLDTAALHVRQSKTPAGVRTIAMPGLLVSDLRAWRTEQRKRRLAAPTWHDANLIVTSPRRPGHGLSYPSVYTRIKDFCAQHGLTPITPHGLRHSWATLMASRNVHPRIVQQALGHANTDMTLRVYSHVSTAMSRQAAAAFDEALAQELRAKSLRR